MMSFPKSNETDPSSQMADYAGILELEDLPTLETLYRKSNTSAAATGIGTTSAATGGSLSIASPSRRTLGTFSVVAITYFFGCGGPLGSEPIISSSGPGIGLPALLLYPLFVTIPYAFMVAELCCAFPEDGGFTVWVLNAFGPFWGFQVGYWSWISGICNMALLPGFFLQILDDYYGPLPVISSSGVSQFCVKVHLALLLAIPSLLGTRLVAKACIGLLFLVLLPVVVFAVWSYSRARDWGDLMEVRHEHNVVVAALGDDEQVGPVSIDWALLLNTLFWAFDGINMASVFAGEVSNPARVYSRAVLFTVLLTLATYIIPMPGAILVDDPNWTYFTRDSYPALAMAIGGSVLKAFFVASSAFSVVGLFLSGVYCKSMQVSGMGESELLPPLFARRNAQFDSPHVAVGVTVVATVALLGVGFDQLLPMANAFAGAVQLLIILSIVRLRRALPFIPRPARVPGGPKTLAALALLPAAVLCYITVDALSSATTALVLLAFLAPGAAFGLYEQRRTRP